MFLFCKHKENNVLMMKCPCSKPVMTVACPSRLPDVISEDRMCLVLILRALGECQSSQLTSQTKVSQPLSPINNHSAPHSILHAVIMSYGSHCTYF